MYDRVRMYNRVMVDTSNTSNNNIIIKDWFKPNRTKWSVYYIILYYIMHNIILARVMHNIIMPHTLVE